MPKGLIASKYKDATKPPKSTKKFNNYNQQHIV